MAIRFFNTMSRKKEDFVSLIPNEVSIYTCGPTVNNYAHIGNFRAFIFFDTLVRYLKYKGYTVNHVMNITDVDDKTIKGAKEHKITLNEFAQRHINALFTDLKTLNITPAKFYPQATQSIDIIVLLIKELMDKGLAYESNGSIYFSVEKFKDYGKLANINIENLKVGASGRMSSDEYDEKDYVGDFALWKAYTEEDGDVYWNTTIGKGRPGWHIECSAMSMHYLGETIDIHCGGIDLIFPHHTNEIAQSEGATGKQFARYWMHNEFLNMKSGLDESSTKMSKRLGNIVYLRDLIAMNYNPMSIRLALISAHYRQRMDFNMKILEQAESTLNSLQNFIHRLQQTNSNTDSNYNIDEVIIKAKEKFEEAMDDDLHTPTALAGIFDFVKTINTNLTQLSEYDLDKILQFLNKVNDVLGIFNLKQDYLDKEIEELIEKRQNARKNKDFLEADRIRERLLRNGIILEDSSNGVNWRRK